MDALVIKLNVIQNRIHLEHEATIDAFSYIQMGKPNKKFITKTKNFTILIENSRYLYLYEQGRPRDQNKKQCLVDLDRDNSDIIGYQIVNNETLFICTMKCMYKIVL